MRPARSGRGQGIRRMLIWALAIGLLSVFVPAGAALTDTSPPAPPTALVAERVDEDTVRVAWMPPADEGGSDVTEYRVYRAESPTGPFELLGTSDDETYEDTTAPSLEEGRYWYEVTAVNDHGESVETSPAPEMDSQTSGGCITLDTSKVPPFFIDLDKCVPDEPEDRIRPGAPPGCRGTGGIIIWAGC